MKRAGVMSKQWWTLTWLVTRREIMDRGRAKSFWIASVLLIIAVAAAAVIPALLQGGKSTARIGIVGNTPALTQAARETGKIVGTDVTVVTLPDLAAADAQLRSGALTAVLVGNSEVLVKQVAVFGGSGIETTLSQVVSLQKLFAQLPPSEVEKVVSQRVALPIHGLLSAGRSAADRFTGLAVAILMYVILVTYGVRITIGVGEEKASRVVEVLLSTLRPVQLLTGKVLGMGLMAIGQIAAIVATYLILGHAVGASAVRGASIGVVLVGALWLVLGYAFYCTAFAAAGSLISRQSDAYNAALPLQIPLILAYGLTYTVIYSTSVNAFFHVLAFIPFTAPVAMPVLVAVGAAPAWQIVVSALISIASTVGMAWLAGTIYGRAILRTGTRLKVRQVLASSG
jgi:ABC-2 type transport system permease protein